MTWAGVPDNLPDQFPPAPPGRVLSLDGDGPAYVAAATVKTLPTAIRRFQQTVLERMFLVGAQTARVHLTADWSRKADRGLVKAVQPYQGNRKGKAKPPLLEPLRSVLEQHELPNVTILLHEDIEADDAMIMDAHRDPENVVVSSEDKDLRITPFQYHDLASGLVLPSAGYGRIEIGRTPAGAPKPLGQGRKFFWWQMIMGDTADHVKGLKTLDGKNVGIQGAYDALKGIHSERECAEFVLRAYRKIDQNPFAEGTLMWLLRSYQDSFEQYVSELQMPGDLTPWLMDKLAEPWKGERIDESALG